AAGGAAVVRVATVGDLVGERIAAVVVRGQIGRASCSGTGQGAVDRAGDDRVGQVGVRGLHIRDQGGEADRGRAVLGHGRRTITRHRLIVDRADRDRDRLRRARLGGVAAAAGGAAVVRVAAVGHVVGERIAAVVVRG